jgi:ribonuclease HI
VYCDRAWGNVRVGVAAILVSPSGIKLCYTARLQFTNEIDKCTNNIAEYEAILLGLHTDSKVVSGQIEKE